MTEMVLFDCRARAAQLFGHATAAPLAQRRRRVRWSRRIASSGSRSRRTRSTTSLDEFRSASAAIPPTSSS